MSLSITTRRGMLRHGASVACAAGVTVVAGGIAEATASTPQEPSAALASLISNALAAQDASRMHYDQVYDPAKARASAEKARIPHVTVPIEGSDYWSTEREGSVRVARGMLERDPNPRHPANAGIRRLVAADTIRKRKARRIERDCGLSAAVTKGEELDHQAAEAEYAVAEHPVATAIDLHAKLAFMVARQMGDGTDWTDQLLADAARIAKMEG